MPAAQLRGQLVRGTGAGKSGTSHSGGGIRRARVSGRAGGRVPAVGAARESASRCRPGAVARQACARIAARRAGADMSAFLGTSLSPPRKTLTFEGLTARPAGNIPAAILYYARLVI